MPKLIRHKHKRQSSAGKRSQLTSGWLFWRRIIVDTHRRICHRSGHLLGSTVKWFIFIIHNIQHLDVSHLRLGNVRVIYFSFGRFPVRLKIIWRSKNPQKLIGCKRKRGCYYLWWTRDSRETSGHCTIPLNWQEIYSTRSSFQFKLKLSPVQE